MVGETAQAGSDKPVQEMELVTSPSRRLAAARGRLPAGSLKHILIEGGRRSHVAAMRHIGGLLSRARMRSSHWRHGVCNSVSTQRWQNGPRNEGRAGRERGTGTLPFFRVGSQ